MVTTPTTIVILMLIVNENAYPEHVIVILPYKQESNTMMLSVGLNVSGFYYEASLFLLGVSCLISVIIVQP